MDGNLVMSKNILQIGGGNFSPFTILSLQAKFPRNLSFLYNHRLSSLVAAFAAAGLFVACSADDPSAPAAAVPATRTAAADSTASAADSTAAAGGGAAFAIGADTSWAGTLHAEY